MQCVLPDDATCRDAVHMVLACGLRSGCMQLTPHPAQDMPLFPRSAAPLETIHCAEQPCPERREPLPSGGGVYQPPPSLTAADVFPFATAQKAAMASSQLPTSQRAMER